MSIRAAGFSACGRRGADRVSWLDGRERDSDSGRAHRKRSRPRVPRAAEAPAATPDSRQRRYAARGPARRVRQSARAHAPSRRSGEGEHRLPPRLRTGAFHPRLALHTAHRPLPRRARNPEQSVGASRFGGHPRPAPSSDGIPDRRRGGQLRRAKAERPRPGLRALRRSRGAARNAPPITRRSASSTRSWVPSSRGCGHGDCGRRRRSR
jgi:hypothetical protein